VGSVKVYTDLNGDGEFWDQGEESRRFELATQVAETAGPNGDTDGLIAGDAIPSHLRLGIYHASSISCPAPTGCAMEIDNVEVVGP
jgi:hypothetical protein